MRSKVLLLAAAAVFAPMGVHAADIYVEPAPEVVPAPVGFSLWFGEVEGAVGYSWLDGDPVDAPDEAGEYLFGNAALRIGRNFAGGLLLQGDIFGEITDVGDDHDDSYSAGAGILGHLAWRDSNRGLFGVYGGYGWTDQDNDGEDTADIYLIGVEGQAYFANSTVYGQVGYLDSDDEDDRAIREAGFARLVGRYFLDPNTKIEAGLAGAFGVMDSDEDDVWLANWSLSAERRFAATPFSAFIGYDGLFLHQDDEDEEVTEHAIKVGFRYAFGGGSEDLLSRDRYGASLDNPAFFRWVGISSGQLE